MLIISSLLQISVDFADKIVNNLNLSSYVRISLVTFKSLP
jgi:hypothetical protein